MKLYDVSDRTTVRLLEDVKGPPGEPVYEKGTELYFHGIDGMYATCFMYGPKMDQTTRVYPPAWTEVEIVEEDG